MDVLFMHKWWRERERSVERERGGGDGPREEREGYFWQQRSC